jgi:hypothetical protein
LASWLPTECIESETWEDILLETLANTRTGDSTFDMRYAALCRMTTETLKVLNEWSNTIAKKKGAKVPEVVPVPKKKVTLVEGTSPKNVAEQVPVPSSQKRPPPPMDSDSDSESDEEEEVPKPVVKRAKVSVMEESKVPVSVPVTVPVSVPVTEGFKVSSDVDQQASALVSYMRLPESQRRTLSNAEVEFMSRIAAYKPNALTEYDLLHMGYQPTSPSIIAQLSFYTRCLELSGVFHNSSDKK